MKITSLPTVTLINPLSGAMCETMTWAQIRNWATKRIHRLNRREWLYAARSAYRDQDGQTLGSMIIGA
jgi:hypothetical protein